MEVYTSYVIYTKANCPWCTKALDLLMVNKDKWDAVMLGNLSGPDKEAHEAAISRLKKRGITTVPYVEMDMEAEYENKTTPIGGYEDLVKHFEDMAQ